MILLRLTSLSARPLLVWTFPELIAGSMAGSNPVTYDHLKLGDKMIVKSKSDKAAEIYEALKLVMPKDLIEDPDTIFVVGGDGFLLSAASEYGFDKTYVPLNAGHLGFLLNDVWESKDHTLTGHAVTSLRERNWMVREIPTLEVRLANGIIDTAINDVFMERASGQTARISVKVDGSCLVSRMVADGVIISTALGSTGYNYSAGGPVVHPLNKNIIVTPSNAHHPIFRPLVLPSTTKVLVSARDTEYRPVRVVVDGRGYEGIEEVNIGFGKEKLRVGYFEGHNFTRRLVQKILNRRD